MLFAFLRARRGRGSLGAGGAGCFRFAGGPTGGDAGRLAGGGRLAPGGRRRTPSRACGCGSAGCAAIGPGSPRRCRGSTRRRRRCLLHVRSGTSLHQRKSQLIAQRVKRPDFSHRNLEIRAQAPCAIDAARGDVQVERRAKARQRCPLRHGFEIVDRFGGLDLHHPQQAVCSIVGLKNEVRIPRRGSGSYGHGLLVAGIDADFELSLVFRLKKANDPIVLELLADGPHEDGAQRNLQKAGSSRPEVCATDSGTCWTGRNPAEDG